MYKAMLKHWKQSKRCRACSLSISIGNKGRVDCTECKAIKREREKRGQQR